MSLFSRLIIFKNQSLLVVLYRGGKTPSLRADDLSAIEQPRRISPHGTAQRVSFIAALVQFGISYLDKRAPDATDIAMIGRILRDGSRSKVFWRQNRDGTRAVGL